MVRLSGRLLLVTIGILSGFVIPSVSRAQDTTPTSGVHIPVKGSPERKAIMDALREGDKHNFDKPVIYKVNYLKVHNGWAWTDVTPLDEKGNALAERQMGKQRPLEGGRRSERPSRTRGSQSPLHPECT